tara:strand:- start:1023 stop:1370 length:348 start_codon:yes stop_codon:yes gene_type:complete
MACVGRCSNYEDRPEFCRSYPQIQDNLPEQCTYHFEGEKRAGVCQPEVCQEHNCCAYPRERGEPAAKSLDDMAGGLPCTHLRWEEVEDNTKIASAEEGISSVEFLRAVVAVLRDT